ncbi:helix-turn-helix domain-containing protein [Caulobacter henricii]|uniref:XRE family transcriptional regulator n=1 Tax=Caulobacter henricii TaxID=69395 RepID=A0A0P0P128_9CAUL|nr:helix-turn-helix domain-containing protein [Caulobacter henricii]ALL14169.1 XRE family transcriptional regulator [Caulobacter henricii]
MTTTVLTIGERLRDWRRKRRLSQLDLACEAEISTRHLSFLETGRAAPSRDMVLRLAEGLGVPLRERNALLLAAGFAPVFPERSLDDPGLDAARIAVEAVLAAHMPFPALVIDRRWTILASNASANLLMAGVDPRLLEPPVNVLRLSLHPDGVAPRIANLAELRGHTLSRLRRELADNGDAGLADLIRELAAYPGGETYPRGGEGMIAVPLRLQTPLGELSFLTTTMTFSGALDVTVSELTIETFLPANPATAAALRSVAAG